MPAGSTIWPRVCLLVFVFLLGFCVCGGGLCCCCGFVCVASVLCNSGFRGARMIRGAGADVNRDAAKCLLLLMVSPGVVTLSLCCRAAGPILYSKHFRKRYSSWICLSCNHDPLSKRSSAHSMV